MQPTITRASWAMIVALGLVWGGTFMVMELALRGISPIWLAFARLGFAALLLTTVWQWRGGQLWLSEDRPWHMLLLAGLLSAALPFMLLSWGLQFVTSGFAGVSMAAIPLIVLPLAHFFLVGERMSLRRSIGFVTGFAGVFILIGGPAVFEASGANGETWGRLACVSAAICYGVNSIITRRLPPIDPVGLSASLMLIGGAILLPLALWKEGIPSSISLETFGYLALLGLVPTAAANLLRVLVIRSAGSTFMSLTNYMVPVWSIFLGAWLLDEALPDGILTSLALILGGVLVSQLGALRRMFSR
ncbi:DMT family transporter [Thalassobius sp. Cn5-15]|uniref:DMT family transporter n=1 Tax=Thalassobius sp. Cn5-15 TaxID=2917763 RepID=UPI001EF3A3C4|nr:DMT family transporter [Thalassobius sp. Cn5-15]MCG7494353.1 DMT family transporter [Thalassobius sp. Cn5-15]